MSFQTLVFLWNTEDDILKNVPVLYAHTIKSMGINVVLHTHDFHYMEYDKIHIKKDTFSEIKFFYMMHFIYI